LKEDMGQGEKSFQGRELRWECLQIVPEEWGGPGDLSKGVRGAAGDRVDREDHVGSLHVVRVFILSETGEQRKDLKIWIQDINSSYSGFYNRLKCQSKKTIQIWITT
jgi:hypothetical protein